MARLNIPQRHREALAALRSLSEDRVQEIRSILDGATSSVGQTEGAASLDPDNIIRLVKSTIADDVRGVWEAVLSLYLVKSQRDETTEQFVQEVCDAMERLEGAFQLPQSERKSFSDKLLSLLGAEAFATVAKAADLETEDERLFCRARILTDLRPVFGTEVADGPKGVIVLHTLKVEFHEQGDLKNHREFYVRLDAKDLGSLKEIIERAEEKAKTLSSVLKNVRVFGLSGE